MPATAHPGSSVKDHRRRVRLLTYETDFCDVQAADFTGAIFRLKAYPFGTANTRRCRSRKRQIALARKSLRDIVIGQ
jgi:hypothetical protein